MAGRKAHKWLVTHCSVLNSGLKDKVKNYLMTNNYSNPIQTSTTFEREKKPCLPYTRLHITIETGSVLA